MQIYNHEYICKYIEKYIYKYIHKRFIDILTNIFANLFAKSMVGDILFAQICLQPPDVNIDTIALVSNIEKVNGIVLNKSENLF